MLTGGFERLPFRRGPLRRALLRSCLSARTCLAAAELPAACCRAACHGGRFLRPPDPSGDPAACSGMDMRRERWSMASGSPSVAEALGRAGWLTEERCQRIYGPMPPLPDHAFCSGWRSPLL